MTNDNEEKQQQQRQRVFHSSFSIRSVLGEDDMVRMRIFFSRHFSWIEWSILENRYWKIVENSFILHVNAHNKSIETSTRWK